MGFDLGFEGAGFGEKGVEVVGEALHFGGEFGGGDAGVFDFYVEVLPCTEGVVFGFDLVVSDRN